MLCTHTYTQTYICQSLVWADFISGIHWWRMPFFLILKSYSFIINLFFCKFAKILNPLNAKSEKELLPERCFVVHQALMSK